MCGILSEFWERQEVVTRKTGTIAPTSKQIGEQSREINVIVDNVVRNWVLLMVIINWYPKLASD